MANNDNELGRNEVRAFIFEIINSMSEAEMRQLLKDLEKWQQSKSAYKRKHPRKSTFIDTDFADDDRAYKGFIRNISESGLFIETEIPLLVNQELTITFSLPHSESPIRITGKIVRTDSNGIGVEFDKTIKGI